LATFNLKSKINHLKLKASAVFVPLLRRINELVCHRRESKRIEENGSTSLTNHRREENSFTRFVGEIQDSGCIIFQGAKDGQGGYGKYFTKDGKQASMLVIPVLIPVVLIQNTFWLVLVTITN
jgi:hypothetical protein